ncbi:MAG: hypothetical protein K1X52_10295 [Pyrinomonadaceae bacterium]|nr:hypothetical protein [Pyrinomonadaceae bacterium]
MQEKIRSPWRYFLIASVAMGFLALYPQISLWVSKGSAWKGSYVVSNYDETAYSGYVNSLVAGNVRKNDPFLATDSTAHESLYSIQFIPAYLIAIPTRLLGISTSTAFILLAFITALLSCFALCWFLFSITGEPLLSSAGALVVLCVGTAAAFQGEMSRMITGSVLIDFFPFVRRYQPGAAFPLFFVFVFLVWRSFDSESVKRGAVYAVSAGLAFTILVFSYFYLWTAAAAWAVCAFMAAFIFLTEKRRQLLTATAILAAIGIISLIPYWKMLSGRTPELDRVQLLERTHSPELLVLPLILGLFGIIMTAILSSRKRIDLKAKEVLIALTFFATPIILFNQQVITGHSLQPVHYAVFIANYLVLAAFILLASAWIRAAAFDSAITKKILVYVASAAILWGFIEASGSARFNAVASEIRDESLPAIQMIEKMRQGDPAVPTRPVVLANNFITSDSIPTFSTFRPLWNPHTSSAGGVSPEENKRLFYLYFYYSGYSGKDLADALNGNSFEITAAVFGSERALPALAKGDAIKPDEIKKEIEKYEQFSRTFSEKDAVAPKLDFLIVPDKAEPNYANIDRWYSRGEGQVTGLFKVFKLTPKF